MKVLLIWEDIPEVTKAYVIEAGTKVAELAKASHGYFINGEDNEAVIALSEALVGAECDYSSHDAGKEHIPGGPFSAVYICGFVM